MSCAISWILSALVWLTAVIDVTGTWQFDCRRAGADELGPTVIVTFKQNNDHLSGDCLVKENGEKSNLVGELKGEDGITWVCRSDREGTATFKGKLDGTEITGTWETAPYFAEGTFTGTKQQ